MNRENSIYKSNKNVYNSQQLKTIRYFAKNIRESKITLHNADKNQSDLLLVTSDFNRHKTKNS